MNIFKVLTNKTRSSDEIPMTSCFDYQNKPMRPMTSYLLANDARRCAFQCLRASDLCMHASKRALYACEQAVRSPAKVVPVVPQQKQLYY